jgi:hypothetical protein
LRKVTGSPGPAPQPSGVPAQERPAPLYCRTAASWLPAASQMRPFAAEAGRLPTLQYCCVCLLNSRTKLPGATGPPGLAELSRANCSGRLVPSPPGLG